ncbi:hypothetical protein WOSG25_380040 [Weissella oryzae SG25]|uniref:Uncharacterized protein n=1 Tax=Weissella oryzae (strain DSM 25784 / JCM 18191 / LMG 30913 / SG25) TaxID=1329250 RepID=A0A069CXW3_WEIOS|nr:hypothetical protein [Weissella oryzae]GAK32103.1 hypothetical protein WOSG25_380040 [Weissella oryzae SG25]
MSDIQEAISTLNNLLISAESAKTLTFFLEGVNELNAEVVSKIETTQTNEIVLLTALLSEAQSKVQQEQLYYVLSPVDKRDVLNDETLGLAFQERWFNFGTRLEDSRHKTRFTQSELDNLQSKLPGLNIEALKVRVEDYDNEHA